MPPPKSCRGFLEETDLGEMVEEAIGHAILGFSFCVGPCKNFLIMT